MAYFTVRVQTTGVREYYVQAPNAAHAEQLARTAAMENRTGTNNDGIAVHKTQELNAIEAQISQLPDDGQIYQQAVNDLVLKDI